MFSADVKPRFLRPGMCQILQIHWSWKSSSEKWIDFHNCV